MKITPIEIRQKTFEKVFRGYDKDEVDAFLLSLSQEWERVIDENKEYRIKLEIAEKEVKKLREVESSLYKTLKTAEDTGTHLIEQANKSAELHMREAQVKADSILREARSKANQMVQDADLKSRHTLEETIKELKSLERECRDIENQRENLLGDLQNIVHNIMEKVNRIASKNSKVSFEGKVDEVKTFLEQRSEPPSYTAPESDLMNNRPTMAKLEDTEPTQESYRISQQEKPKASSFFDELDNQ